MSGATRLAAARQLATEPGRSGARRGRRGLGLSVLMGVITALWMVPLLFAAFVSLRPTAETSRYGYLSWPQQLTLDNFRAAWTESGLPRYFWNSLVVTVPSVILVLSLASCAAYVLTRRSTAFNITLLIFFTASNLLPQQVVITPLYRMYLSIPLPEWLSSTGLLYDSALGLVVIHVAFQMGFCVFVLSNYIKTIPPDMYEAASIDGASYWTQFWRLTLPLCRPARAALATLLTTWIYNDFVWAVSLMSTGSKRPVTSALANLQGEFVSNNNLVAAAALMAAVPTVLVFVALQKHFIAGLALGSSK